MSILADKVDPSMLQPVLLDRAEPLAIFEVGSAVLQQNLQGSVYYSWYYDYDHTKNIPLPFYSLCGDSPRCLFSPCSSKPNSNVTEHRLLVVVSDSKLKADPKGPLDFPVGAAFDTAQWQLTLTGACPDPK